MNLKRCLRVAMVALLFLSSFRSNAQSNAQPDPLFKTIQSLDTKLFDAYHHCDLTTLGAMVSDDLEFYHDQTGVSVGKQHSSPPSSKTSAERWSGHFYRTRWRCTHLRDMVR